MNKPIYLILFESLIAITYLCCVNCNGKQTSDEQKIPSANDSIAHAISNEPTFSGTSTEFLNLFENVKPNGLHIYTYSYGKNGEINHSPFEGTKVDVKKFRFVNDSNIFINIKACREGHSNIFAAQKFAINDQFIGLIMRQHSQYQESLIQLMLWDKSNEKIIERVDLADAFGDEGWYFNKESWITNFGSSFTLASYQKDSNYDFSTNKRTVTNSYKVSSFHGNKSVTKDTVQIDTIRFRLTQWKY